LHLIYTPSASKKSAPALWEMPGSAIVGAAFAAGNLFAEM
jgi:hypothetical protein